MPCKKYYLMVATKIVLHENFQIFGKMDIYGITDTQRFCHNASTAIYPHCLIARCHLK